ncbi:hypothetical protein MRX96_059753 [Rhipicephalus microplus]
MIAEDAHLPGNLGGSSSSGRPFSRSPSKLTQRDRTKHWESLRRRLRRRLVPQGAVHRVGQNTSGPLGHCQRCNTSDTVGNGPCAVWRRRRHTSFHVFRTAMIISASIVAALLGCFIAGVITRAFMSQPDHEESIAFASSSSTAMPEPEPRVRQERPPAYTDILREQVLVFFHLVRSKSCPPLFRLPPSSIKKSCLPTSEAMRRPMNSTPRTNPAYVIDIT